MTLALPSQCDASPEETAAHGTDDYGTIEPFHCGNRISGTLPILYPPPSRSFPNMVWQDRCTGLIVSPSSLDLTSSFNQLTGEYFGESRNGGGDVCSYGLIEDLVGDLMEC